MLLVTFVTLVAFLLSQGNEGWCSEDRATQKGRGRLELVVQELIALGLKSKRSSENAKRTNKQEKYGLPGGASARGGFDGIFKLDEGAG